MIYNLAVVYFWLAGLTGAWTGLIGRGPDSPAICSDTLGLWWSRCSGFRSGFSGLGSPDTPGNIQILWIFGLESHTGQTGLTGLVYRSDRC